MRRPCATVARRNRVMFPLTLLDAAGVYHPPLRTLLDAEPFRRSESRLTLALGQREGNAPFVCDLARLPHLLIAGADGSGKSSALRAFIATLLYRATAEELRLVLVDCDRTGLTAYDGIPHLLTGVISEARHGSNAFAWAAREMQHRYKRLSAAGVRNIAVYNQVANRALHETCREPMAHVVIVVDELAPLMRTCADSVQRSFIALAQMGRAAGIHVIITTRECSATVVSGHIKVNTPARMAFRVALPVQSRTILDRNGAEHLVEFGDVLFLPPTASAPLRLRAPSTSRLEASRIADFLRAQAPATLNEPVTADPVNSE
jgi:DNA segregation ATPase FtsK/SpoIIIE, S-DNA-T family